MTGITLERIVAPKVYLMRFGPEHHKYGDPYLMTAVIEVTGEEAVVKGAHGGFPGGKAFSGEMQKLGVKRVVFERIRKGEVIRHRADF